MRRGIFAASASHADAVAASEEFPLISPRLKCTFVTVHKYIMPLFQFHIGAETVRIGPEDVARQFTRSPETFGYRFSDQEREALRDPAFLERMRQAAAEVNGRALTVASSIHGVFVRVEALPWRTDH